MMGIDSCGMLISAVHHENGEEKLHLLMVDPHIPGRRKAVLKNNEKEFSRQRELFFVPKARGSSAVGAARDKGAILSRERMAPFDPQENTRGSAP